MQARVQNTFSYTPCGMKSATVQLGKMGIKMFVEMLGLQILEAYPKEIIMDENSNLHAKMI